MNFLYRAAMLGCAIYCILTGEAFIGIGAMICVFIIFNLVDRYLNKKEGLNL